jgi:CRP-like cAMP-binding protein
MVSVMSPKLFWVVKPAKISVKLFPGSNVIVPMITERPRNYLLSALPPQEWEALASHFEKVDFPPGHLLMHEGEAVRKIFFPIDCVISTVAVFESGATVEMAAIGREGVVPPVGCVVRNTSLAQQIVQIPGSALAIRSDVFCRIRIEQPVLAILVDSYAEAFMALLLRSVACNAVHGVEQRAARWLLMYHDRAGKDTFPLTQEFFAACLGVARPTVNVISRQLRQAGTIRYSRGQITILNRDGLQKTACECYGIINRHYEESLCYAHEQIAEYKKALSA